jgi:hypothetical protein
LHSKQLPPAGMALNDKCDTGGKEGVEGGVAVTMTRRFEVISNDRLVIAGADLPTSCLREIKINNFISTGPVKEEYIMNPEISARRY